MKELKRYLDSRIGEFSFYFEDLRGGYTYSFMDKKMFPASESIILPLAIAFMKEVENYNLVLDSKVTINKDNKVNSAYGILNLLSHNEFTIRDLLIAAVVQRDITAANKLIDLIGINKINDIFLQMGLKKTKLVTVLSDKLQEEENETSPREIAHCFKLLYKKEYLSEDNCEYLIQLLKMCQVRSKVPYYLPKNEWDNIANNPGRLEKIESDSALLCIEKGEFIFVVMAKNLPSNVYGATIISRLAKMMWDIVETNWK